MKAFIKAVKRNLNSVSDEMLEALFLKVYTDCNGFITWVRRAPPAAWREAGGTVFGQWSARGGLKVGSHIKKPPVDSGVHAG